MLFRSGRLGINFFEWLRSAARDEFTKSRHFTAPAHIDDLARYARDIVSEGNQTGEGWFLTGEMLELIHTGTPNIVCTQPFACLPNHVVGKGVIKELRHRYPGSNIVAIDYDPAYHFFRTFHSHCRMSVGIFYESRTLWTKLRC